MTSPTPSTSTSLHPHSTTTARQFTQADSDAVYALADSPTPLGEKVKDALGIIDRSVQEYGSRYNLELVPVEEGMKEALATYLEDEKARGDDEEVKAILVGTRRGDPHGATLKPFHPTDPGWPPFMRVHPILDWTYAQIWDFLRDPSLTLGGEGTSQEWYTSLGSTDNTFPNPLLRATDDKSVLGGWRPAWELQDWSMERAGRGKRPPEDERRVEPGTNGVDAVLSGGVQK
ncbi:FAD synthetase [Pseudohyphozyma bogoriensis]|nr:FAD synthetase [Pseudohyphozyma bogoriensis]